MTITRHDIAILAITQPVAERIRGVVSQHTALLPVVLEIPSKEEPWDAQKDPVLAKVNTLLGVNNIAGSEEKKK